MERPSFASDREFGRHLGDVGFWQPYVRHVCRLHRIEFGPLQPGESRTNPVFLVEDRCAVKFYGPYEEGARRQVVEREVCLLMAREALPVPILLAQGELFSSRAGWPWPYLVSRAVTGTAWREAGARLDDESRRGLARQIGSLLRRLHAVPAAGPVLGQTRDGYLRWLEERARECAGDHVRWQSMPPHLVRQIGSFVPPPRDLVGSQGLRLLHADLAPEHVLLEERKGRWRGAGLVGFGSARMGEPLYDLGAAHLGLFRGDKRHLAALLTAYGAGDEIRRDLPRRALALALLHERDLLGPIFREFPELGLTPTLDGVARRLWDLEKPGLRGESA